MCFISKARKNELLAKEEENESLKTKIKMLEASVLSFEANKKVIADLTAENNDLKAKIVDCEAKLSLLNAKPKAAPKATSTKSTTSKKTTAKK